jgi:hypothetical protein
MPYSDGLRRLATVVELLETTGADVVDARPCEAAENRQTDRFRVELRLDLPLGAELSFPEAAGDVDREEHAAPSESPSADAASVPEDGDATDAADGDASDADTDRVPCRSASCDRSFAGEHGMKIHYSKTHVDEKPAYRDPQRLRDAYEATDDFAAMRERLGADVSTETIRRYAVEYGIHGPGAGAPNEPPTIDRSALDPAIEPVSADAAAAPPVAADRPARTNSSELDEALPADLTIEDVKSTVERADTLRQVASSLDLDRERARALLSDLNLLDLVHGRVATKRRRDELKSEIDRRLEKGVERALSS